jgi:hypothetical protein
MATMPPKVFSERRATSITVTKIMAISAAVL